MLTTAATLSENTPHRSPLTVLLVDDHDGIRRALRRALSDIADIQIISEANSVAAAVEAVHRTRPDVMVLDFHLPDGNGLHVLRALKVESSTATPVASHTPLTVVFSNDVASEHTRACLREGAEAVFDKSTDLFPLRRFLQEAARRRAESGTLHSERLEDTLSRTAL